MLRPFLLTRASIGLAATAVENVASMPGRVAEAVSSLPGVPVRLAGGFVQSYLHAGQALTDFAVRGDAVIASVFPARADQPEWATFDEDETDSDEVLDVSYRVYGTASGRGRTSGAEQADVPTGRITRRDS
ncbi:hypothetical protein [Dietzia alimentaria]|uniref:hypothetical protein n=1 Tax=Dietzia alimentaria TaxID=665550 RepID=UPI000299D3B3|nr:hypothetical protein [Dietzia alimentaria]